MKCGPAHSELTFCLVTIFCALGGCSGLPGTVSGQPTDAELESFFWYESGIDISKRFHGFRIMTSRDPENEAGSPPVLVSGYVPGVGALPGSAEEIVSSVVERYQQQAINLNKSAGTSVMLVETKSSRLRNGLDVVDIFITYSYTDPDVSTYVHQRLLKDDELVWSLTSQELGQSADRKRAEWIMESFEKFDVSEAYADDLRQSGLDWVSWAYTWDSYSGNSAEEFFEQELGFRFNGDHKNAYINNRANLVLIRSDSRTKPPVFGVNRPQLKSRALARSHGFSGFEIHRIGAGLR